MGIKIDKEQLITLADAAAMLPRRRAGRKPHVSTIYRWASRGLKGIVLETLVVGGTTCTSVDALQRFFDGLSQRIPNQPGLQPKQIEMQLRRASKILDDAGI